MKAARIYTAKDLRVDDIPEEAPIGDEVRIKVKWCGICGSDLHEYMDSPVFSPGTTPNYVTGFVNPVVMGHEFSGEVVAIGPECTKFKIGDRVVPEPLMVCYKCPPCKNGDLNICHHLGFLGFVNNNGGFAEYCNFTSSLVHKLPDSMSYEEGAIVEPLAVGYHSLKRGNFKPGMFSVVAGAGPIGLSTIGSLKAMGAGKIVCVQRKSMRQQYALENGADLVLDPEKDDVEAKIREMTGGAGADIAFETTSSEQCFHLLRHCIKNHGTEVITSIWVNTITMQPNEIVLTEKNMVGSICYNGPDFEEVIELMRTGKLKVPKYVTKKIYLEDIVTEGFHSLVGAEKKKQVKILVTPDKSLLK